MFGVNIYSLERVESDDFGYDQMLGCVVIAVDEQEARDYAADRTSAGPWSAGVRALRDAM